MSTTPIIRYPLDPTGTNPNNLVQGELHSPVRRNTRAVATTYGAFFSQSLVVRDTSNNQVLTKGVQYFAAELYEVPTAKYGQEVCGIVVITDSSVSDQISLDYQAVGGEFSTSADAVIAQLNALNLDDRPVAWGSIIAKPSEYPPSHHLHDIGDVYGFEYVVHALERIKAAILMGDDISHDAIYQYVDNSVAGFQSSLNQSGAALTAHIADHGNPHAVTAAQVGAYAKAAVDAFVNTLQNSIDAHAARTDNPHATTAAQVGAVSSTTYNAGVANLQGQINGKQPTGNYAVLESSVAFWDLTARGTIYCNNDIWAFNSDQRLKTDVRAIPGAMSKLRQIRGVLYKYRPEAIARLGMEERDYMGFLAQEIQAVAPEVVGLAPFDRDPETGASISGQHFLTIQYDKLTALIAQGLKETDERVSELARRLGQTDLV